MYEHGQVLERTTCYLCDAQVGGGTYQIESIQTPTTLRGQWCVEMDT